jgi:hypothetical protein
VGVLRQPRHLLALPGRRRAARFGDGPMTPAADTSSVVEFERELVAA